MKKFFKYILLSIFFIFLININAKAYVTDSQAADALKSWKNADAAYYCRYSLTGAADEDYSAIIAISSDYEKAQGVTDEAGAEDILNWKLNTDDSDTNSDDLGFGASDYYSIYGCPMVYYEHFTGIGTAHYAINQEHLNDLIKTFSASPVGDNVFVLVQEDNLSSFSCDYVFERSENLFHRTYNFKLDITNLGTSSTLNQEASAGVSSKNGHYISAEVRVGTSNIKYCPSVYNCETKKEGSGMMSGVAYEYSVFYSNYKLYDFEESKCQRVDCVNTDDPHCSPGNIESEICPQFNWYNEKIDEYLDNYQSCDTEDFNCKTQTLIKYNQQKKQIGEWCNQIFKGLNYSNPCTLRCLDFNDTIGQKEIDHGMYNSSKKVCGFSEKLTRWIANIVRWGKYLIPVIVIVLGILDFIKVIAADKDDEMKKAQGRFVKRLIAAALIFIIPFIIEFVLVKLGFNYNGCGIIDL